MTFTIDKIKNGWVLREEYPFGDGQTTFYPTFGEVLARLEEVKKENEWK